MGAPRAVLWDLDGTLVDTEPYWIEAEYALAEKYDAPWSHEHAMELVGSDLLDSGRYIQRVMGLELAPEAIVEFLLDAVVARTRESIPWRPGARELLGALCEAEVPCGLVTMSYRRLVEPIAEGLAKDTFSVIVTGDQVSKGKPDPEAYLTAAAALGLDPEDCVAIEDSATGAASAESAGCIVLVVPNHVPVPPGPGRVFRDTLVGISPTDLAALSRPSIG